MSGRSPHAIPCPVELGYDLAALAGVAAFGFCFFWSFAILLVPAMLASVALMTVESILIQSEKKEPANGG